MRATFAGMFHIRAMRRMAMTLPLPADTFMEIQNACHCIGTGRLSTDCPYIESERLLCQAISDAVPATVDIVALGKL